MTQHIDTSNAAGRMMLNILMSFSQFEREMTADRIRDKICATKKKGMWVGGPVPLGYKAETKRLDVKCPLKSIAGRLIKKEVIAQLGAVLGSPEAIATRRASARANSPRAPSSAAGPSRLSRENVSR